jgi:maltose alpha-D-glucosyltransferase/alpha-amylase
MSEVEEYVGAGDKLQMLFGFGVNQGLWHAVASGDARILRHAVDEAAPLPSVCQWANFIRNHDELDLGRLTPEERAEVYDAFAPDPAMRLYDRGIRRRLAPMLGADRARRELIHSLMLSLSGTPVLYYGDEIGMGENLELPERESVRTPMQWSSETGAGFSSGASDFLVRPLIDDGPFAYPGVNVASQQLDPHSFLNWLRRAISVRKTCRELSWGSSRSIETDNDAVFASACRWENSVMICVHNLSPASLAVCLAGTDGAERGGVLAEVFADREYSAWRDRSSAIELAGYGYRWFRHTGPADSPNASTRLG